MLSSVLPVFICIVCRFDFCAFDIWVLYTMISCDGAISLSSLIHDTVSAAEPAGSHWRFTWYTGNQLNKHSPASSQSSQMVPWPGKQAQRWSALFLFFCCSGQPVHCVDFDVGL